MGNTVYTIEGNTSDSCAAHEYDVNYSCIYGYGTPQYPSTTQSDGSVAGEVWTCLKGYGYSDSVAAGIIGNMMRECGGDTLDLDWDIVGHYNGDAYYGGNYNGITYSEFLRADTRTAAIAFERVYERCGDYANEDSRRANNAEAAYNKFHK